ncbi:MAG: hypothetical protein OEL87_02805 [Nanoarchaeota archaeon]|nr:hypothetical protein [Nanoarchaeota archaeon]
MKKVFLFGVFAVLILISFASAENVCVSTPGCEGTIGPIYGDQGFQEDEYFGCLWHQYSWPPYFDRCTSGGKWYHYGPDDSPDFDAYSCYGCAANGLNCDNIRRLKGGSSFLVCKNCDCRDYIKGFPEPECTQITGSSCVDEKCCVIGKSFTDYRDEMVYTETPGKYTSCVASARKDCGLMPAKNETDIQSTAAKSRIFNPSIYVDVVLALLLGGVGYLIFKR